jgi:hypothetical protein
MVPPSRLRVACPILPDSVPLANPSCAVMALEILLDRFLFLVIAPSILWLPELLVDDWLTPSRASSASAKRDRHAYLLWLDHVPAISWPAKFGSGRPKGRTRSGRPPVGYAPLAPPAAPSRDEFFPSHAPFTRRFKNVPPSVLLCYLRKISSTATAGDGPVFLAGYSICAWSLSWRSGPVSSVQPPESIPCRRRCRPAGPG